MRFIDVLCLGLALVGAVFVFNVKHQADEANDERRALERSIQEDRDAIALLRTEWSLLNQPERLQSLMTQLGPVMQLEPVTIRQISSLDELPLRPLEFTPSGNGGRYGGYAGLGAGDVITDGVVQ